MEMDWHATVAWSAAAILGSWKAYDELRLRRMKDQSEENAKEAQRLALERAETRMTMQEVYLQWRAIGDKLSKDNAELGAVVKELNNELSEARKKIAQLSERATYDD